MKTIVFNGAPLTWEVCGIQMYTQSLLIELLSRDDGFYYKIIVPKEIEFDLKGKGEFIVKAYPKIFPKKYMFFNRGIWEIYQIPKIVRNIDAIGYFTPYQSLSRRSYGMPTTVMIHDALQFDREIEPRDSGRQFVYNKYKKGLKKANKIITISSASQIDIAKKLNKEIDEITVAYEGIDQLFLNKASTEEVEKIKNKYNIHAPYVLYVGGFHRRKNVIGALEEFSLFSKNYPDWKFAIVGQPMHSGKGVYGFEEIESVINKLGINNKIIFINKTTREELRAIYRGASLFLYLSFYEGFGLPPLEASSQEVPVITSDVSSIPEIMGEGALLVDPKLRGAAADAMTKIVEDKVLKEKLIKNGLLRIDNFTWKKTADIILEKINIY